MQLGEINKKIHSHIVKPNMFTKPIKKVVSATVLIKIWFEPSLFRLLSVHYYTVRPHTSTASPINHLKKLRFTEDTKVTWLSTHLYKFINWYLNAKIMIKIMLLYCCCFICKIVHVNKKNYSNSKKKEKVRETQTI